MTIDTLQYYNILIRELIVTFNAMKHDVITLCNSIHKFEDFEIRFDILTERYFVLFTKNWGIKSVL